MSFSVVVRGFPCLSHESVCFVSHELTALLFEDRNKEFFDSACGREKGRTRTPYSVHMLNI